MAVRRRSPKNTNWISRKKSNVIRVYDMLQIPSAPPVVSMECILFFHQGTTAATAATARASAPRRPHVVKRVLVSTAATPTPPALTRAQSSRASVLSASWAMGTATLSTMTRNVVST